MFLLLIYLWYLLKNTIGVWLTLGEVAGVLGPLLTITLANIFSIYKLTKNKQKGKFVKYSLGIISFSYVPFFYFFNYFFASHIYILVMTFLFLILLNIATWANLKKFGIPITIIVLTVSIISMTSGFEEDYCWDKGDKLQKEAEEKGQETMIKVPDWIKETDSSFYGPESMTSVSWLAHLECHENFNLSSALKDKLRIN